MAVEYKNVFKPCVLKNGVILKNRICYSNGQQTFVGGPEAGPSEAMIDDVAIFARSGASLMSFGHFGSMGGGANPRMGAPIDKKEVRAKGGRVVAVSTSEKLGSAANFDYEDTRTFNLLGQAAEAAHLYDTKLLVKLGASFPKGVSLNGCEEREERLLFPVPKDDLRFSKPDMGPMDPFTADPSFVGGEQKVPTREELKANAATKEQIVDAIEDVVDMCVRYKNAGFDGTSIRGDRWGLNASTNFRDDEYGGEIENRGRFQLELFRKIKEVCGPQFLVEVVMPGDSTHGHDGQIPHGYTEDEFIRFMMLVEDFVDIVEVRELTGMGYQCLGYNSTLNEHNSLSYAKHLREAGFQKTIAVNGGYNDPEEMEKIISEGIIDLVSTARTFRAEPYFMEKLHSKGKEVPTPCLRCNKCHGTYEGVCGCSINPKDALHHRLPMIIKDATRSKKVAIIGGGLVGMRTACFAAERGHQVTLFEKSDKLGGKAAYYAPLYPQQWPMNRYLGWVIDELDRRGVKEIRMSCEPTPEALAKEGFEAVIACTGSHEICPPIEGADAEGVWKNEDIYFGHVVPGDKVVIVGGGDVSTETAIYLASLGKDVTVLTRKEVLMKKQFRAHGPHMTNVLYLPELGYGGTGACWTAYDNLKPIYKANTKKISPKAVTYVKDGKEVTIEADTVIVSGGYQPYAEEALQYADCTTEFYMAGDDRIDSTSLMFGNRYGFGRACML